MNSIRVFIAIELPSEVKSNLSNLIATLRLGRERTVKWVNSDNIHLTLKFLGSIPEQKVVDITSAMDRATEGFASFDLKLDGVGAFPNLRSPHVVWAGIGGDVPVLVNLQKKVEQALIPLRFALEKRSFSAHLTLGRVRDNTTRQERANLGETLGDLKVKTSLPFTVKAISLIKSTLTQSGAIYDQLASVELDKRWNNVVDYN